MIHEMSYNELFVNIKFWLQNYWKIQLHIELIRIIET